MPTRYSKKQEECNPTRVSISILPHPGKDVSLTINSANLQGAGKQDALKIKESQGLGYERQVLDMFSIKSAFRSELWTCQQKKRK